MRLIILGNAGSGKSTLAAKIAAEQGASVLSLDDVAFVTGTPERRPLSDSVANAVKFIEAHERCVIEGCYADIIEQLLPRCTALVFLKPGVDVCLAHCTQRPWEPDKFESAEAQDRQLAFLLEWVRQYETRTDTFGLAQHRAVYDTFDGPKAELAEPAMFFDVAMSLLT